MEEVRVIININRSILTSLTSLTPFYTLACIGQNFSVWHKKFLEFVSIWHVFRGKRGKEVRVSLPLSIFLLPLPQNRGKSREERREEI
jgi:hypothetical protein